MLLKFGLLFIAFATLTATLVHADYCRRNASLPLVSGCGYDQSIRNEGECLCCWFDSENIPRIGVNFNLKHRNARKILARYNIDLDDVLEDCNQQTTNNCLNQGQAEEIFKKYTYTDAESCADAYAPGLPDAKRSAVVDLALRGCRQLNAWTKLQRALHQRDWEEAVAALRTYKWCKQNGDRCDADADCLEGVEPPTVPPLGTCTAETSCTSADGCSGDPDCSCFETQSGDGFCSRTSMCAVVSDCSQCGGDQVCAINTCCSGPTCMPLSDFCPPKGQEPMVVASRNITRVERVPCLYDGHCRAGQSCVQHTTGRFCA